MSFSRLAAVEIQLILRLCDLRTLIALARCSRFTLAAASCSFACEHALVPVRTSRPDWHRLLAETLAAFASGLARFMCVSFHSVQCQSGSPVLDSRSAGVKEFVLSLPRLKALHATERRIHAVLLAHFLAHPAFAHLTELHLGRSAAQDSTAELLVTHLPALSTFSVQYDGLCAWLNVLPRLSALTDLRLTDANKRDVTHAPTMVAQCTRLRSLALTQVDMRAVGTMLVSPSSLVAPTIERLELHSLHLMHGAGVDSDPVAFPWSALFRALKRLYSLHVSNCYGIDALLQGLVDSAEPPAGANAVSLARCTVSSPLEILRLEPHSFLIPSLRVHTLPASNCQVPDVSMLDRVLRVRPCMRVLLRVRTLGAMDKDTQALMNANEWSPLRERFFALELEAPIVGQFVVL